MFTCSQNDRPRATTEAAADPLRLVQLQQKEAALYKKLQGKHSVEKEIIIWERCSFFISSFAAREFALLTQLPEFFFLFCFFGKFLMSSP